MEFHRVDGAVIRGTIIMEGTSTFVRVLGKESRNILLTGNDLRNAKKATVLGNEVPKDAVQFMTNVPVKRW